MINFASLDAFTKGIAGAHEKTGLGGFVSLFAYAFMVYLFASEFVSYQQVQVVEKLALDKFSDKKTLETYLDLSFFEIACSDLHILYRNQNNPKHVVDITSNLTAEKDGDHGCRVHGSIIVPRIAGTVEVSPRAASNAASDRIELKQMTAFNASHKINSLSFGKIVPGSSNVLDGQVLTRTDGIYQYQYHVKVVPTSFTPLHGPTELSNQYSSTFYVKKVIDPSSRIAVFMQRIEIPGFFIRFELSSISILKSETKKTFLQFLTSICAIVGGVYASAGFFDGVLHQSLAKKVE